jgi:hypothetical protein
MFCSTSSNVRSFNFNCMLSYWFILTIHGDHSDLRKRHPKRPETAIKWRITALTFTVVRCNTSIRFTLVSVHIVVKSESYREDYFFCRNSKKRLHNYSYMVCSFQDLF